MLQGIIRKSWQHRKYGITLVEILVSMVLLSMVMLGLVNVFLTSKRLVFRSANTMVALGVARCTFEPLNKEIRQDTWNTASSNLTVTLSSGNRTGASQIINSINFTPVYNVTNATTSTNLIMRKVIVNITWNENQP